MWQYSNNAGIATHNKLVEATCVSCQLGAYIHAVRKLDVHVLVKSEGSVPAPFPWHVLMSRRLLWWLICVLASERNLQGTTSIFIIKVLWHNKKSAQTSIFVDATLEIMHCRVLEVLQVSLTSHNLKSFAKCFIQAAGSQMVSTSVYAVVDLQLSQSRSETYNRFDMMVVSLICFLLPERSVQNNTFLYCVLLYNKKAHKQV